MKSKALAVALVLATSCHGSASAYYVCMYQCNPSGTMLDGMCQSSRCSSNPSGICWSGTGSGAFAAESFQIDSYSDCTDYVSAMLEGHTRRRALQSGGSEGMAANSYQNRQTAWFKGAKSVLEGVASCATSSRRNLEKQAAALTGKQAAEIFDLHRGQVRHEVDQSAVDTTDNHAVASRRNLDEHLDCPQASSCSDCVNDDITEDSEAFWCAIACSCHWNTATSNCDRDSSSNTVSSVSDCPSNSGTVSYRASQMRHCLNQKAASWVVDKCEDVACEYISGGCSPCCNVLGRVLDATINDWLVNKGDQLLTKAEDAAAEFVTTHIFGS
eukprot:COSAG05_NODE_2995_length_2424_cov_4.145376_1_plen_328_part_00